MQHIIERNKIDKNIRKSENRDIFQKSILKFIQPSQNRVYSCHNPKGIKLLRVTFVNRNLSTVFRTLLIRYTIVAKILEFHIITFFTVQTIYKKVWSFWSQSFVLFPMFQIWIMPGWLKSWKYFYAEILWCGKENLDHINAVKLQM